MQNAFEDFHSTQWPELLHLHVTLHIPSKHSVLFMTKFACMFIEKTSLNVTFKWKSWSYEAEQWNLVKVVQIEIN